MKKTLLTILISGIIFTSIGATAAYVYTARDIGYQPSDENWNVTNANDALTSLKDDLNTITNKVEGIERVYKTGEVELVALVADDSFYKDSNDKYVLSNSDTGRTLLADTSTYKSLASTEECIGEVGADTAVPFKGGVNPDIFPNSVTISCTAYGRGYLTNTAGVTNIPTFGVYKKITQSYGGSYTDLLAPNTTIKEYDEEGNVTTTNKGKVSTFTHNLLDTTMYVSLELSGMQGYKGKDADYSISRTITLSKS